MCTPSCSAARSPDTRRSDLADASAAIEAVYKLEDGVAHPSAFSAGPWDPGLQHGGAPTALIGAVVNDLPAASPMQIARMTIDLMRPIRVAPMNISTRIVRDGRQIQLVEALIEVGGKECVRASVLRTRVAALPLETSPLPTGVPAPDQCPPAERGVIPVGAHTFGDMMEMRNARGDAWRGPSAVWFHMGAPLIAGRTLTPLMRALASADFCNGISATLKFDDWTFINGDLTVHLAREPVGEWILLDAETWLNADGRGLAIGKLGDERGYFGRAAQSLVIAKR